VTERLRNKLYIVLIYVVLTLAIIVAFEQVRQSEFAYDDGQYIIENPQVKSGLTAESIRWAFTSSYASNWHPLTWISHMTDCQFFGLNPLWHHLTNLFFHIANTLLLFWVFKRMTGQVWPSAFVAAAFALHPLHVESVAWVAERKDVLSGFFWMLTMAAYVQYAKWPGVWKYLLVLLFFCLGLMAKPMLVTLPFVLFLLDYWPLGRFSSRKFSTRHLIVEKIPLFVLAGISSVITVIVQQGGGAVAQPDILPFRFRIANALVSYLDYIVKMVYPSRLAVLYPHPRDSLPTWQIVVCLIILMIVSVGVIYLRRRRYLAMGWLWYLGTLVPVIGLIQVGTQAMADRYTYLPSIGIFIMAAWGAAELSDRWRYCRTVFVILAGLLLVGMVVCTRAQVRYWQNNIILYEHTLSATKDNYMIHKNYGCSLCEKGRYDEALVQFKEFVRIRPGSSEGYGLIGRVFLEQGKLDDAVLYFTEALRIKPDWLEVRNKLGAVYYRQGRFDLAVEQLQAVADIYADAGDFPRAIETIHKAIELASSSGQQELAGKIGERLQQYKAGKLHGGGQGGNR